MSEEEFLTIFDEQMKMDEARAEAEKQAARQASKR